MDTADSMPTVGEADAFLEKYDRAIARDITLRNHSLKILHGLVQLARIHPHGDFYHEPLPESLRDSYSAIQQAVTSKTTANS